MLNNFIIPLLLLIIGLIIEYHSGLFAQGSNLVKITIQKIHVVPLRKTAVLLLAIVLISAAFLGLIMPSSQVVTWAPSKDTVPNNEQPTESTNGGLVVRQSSAEGTFITSKLLSNDTFPTDVSINISSKTRKIYAGTYGAGVYLYQENGSWKSIGLRNTVVTTIVADKASEPVLAATNTGIYLTENDGNTWEQRGLINELVTHLVRDPNRGNILIAGTLHGIYRSVDLGKTWIGPMYETESIISLNIAPSDTNRVYFTTQSGLVFRSYDNGMSWDMVYKHATPDTIVLGIDPSNANIIYMGTSKDGLFKTIDAGATWNYIGLLATPITSILVPTTAPSTLYVGTTDFIGMLVSWNGGESWQNWGILADNVLTLIEDKSDPGAIILTARNRGLLKTRDAGQTWTEMGLDRPKLVPNFEIADLVELGDKPGHLLGRTYYTGIIESQDGGASWSPLPPNVGLLGAPIRAIQADPKDTRKVYVSLQGGAIYFSPDAGITWRSITANLPIGGYPPVAIANNAIYAGASNQGVWKREKESQLWHRTGMGQGAIVQLEADISDNAKIYALDDLGILYKSVDGGISWTDVYSRVRDFALDPSETDRILAATKDSVNISNDGGLTWKETRSFPPVDLGYGPKVIASSDIKGLYFVGLRTRGLMSKNYGQDWEEVVFPDDGQLYVSRQTHLYLASRSQLYYSEDYAKTWVPLRGDTAVGEAVVFEQLNNNTLIAGTKNMGLLISNDNGTTWRKTSLDNEYHVLFMKVNRNIANPDIHILSSTLNGIVLLNSPDSAVWRRKATIPCQALGAYQEEITANDGPNWQILCLSPRALFVIHPFSGKWDQVDLAPVGRFLISQSEPEIATVQISDALYLDDGDTIIETNDHRLIVKIKGVWYPAGYSEHSWSLPNNSTKGILLTDITQNHQVIQPVIRSERPLSAYIFLVSIISLLIVCMFLYPNPKGFLKSVYDYALNPSNTVVANNEYALIFVMFSITLLTLIWNLTSVDNNRHLIVISWFNYVTSGNTVVNHITNVVTRFFNYPNRNGVLVSAFILTRIVTLLVVNTVTFISVNIIRKATNISRRYFLYNLSRSVLLFLIMMLIGIVIVAYLPYISVLSTQPVNMSTLIILLIFYMPISFNIYFVVRLYHAPVFRMLFLWFIIMWMFLIAGQNLFSMYLQWVPERWKY